MRTKVVYKDLLEKKIKQPKITYDKLFWLFFFGSIIGCGVEGLFCLYKYGRWETHVVSMWGPFCILYGMGADLFYVVYVLMRDRNVIMRFFAYGLMADVIELICGLVLEFGLHMRAWSYLKHYMNLRGHISLRMTLEWGVMGTAFSFLVPSLERLFAKMKHKAWHVTCICLTVFMAINLAFTAVCIVRWKDRHFGVEPANKIERWLDKTYDDEYMQDRFCEWYFIK